MESATDTRGSYLQNQTDLHFTQNKLIQNYVSIAKHFVWLNPVHSYLPSDGQKVLGKLKEWEEQVYSWQHHMLLLGHQFLEMVLPQSTAPRAKHHSYEKERKLSHLYNHFLKSNPRYKYKLKQTILNKKGSDGCQFGWLWNLCRLGPLRALSQDGSMLPPVWGSLLQHIYAGEYKVERARRAGLAPCEQLLKRQAFNLIWHDSYIL